MESKQHAASVIANLMGLLDLTPRKPVGKKHKVLSENYLHKVASIGVREKRSTRESHSFKMTIDEQCEFKDIYEVPVIPRKEKHCNQTLRKGKGNSTMEKGKGNSTMEKGKGNLTMEKLADEKCWHCNKYDAVKYSSNEDHLLRRLERPGRRNVEINSQHRHEYGFPKNPCRKLNFDYSHNFPSLQLDTNDRTCFSPTEIVVLKPNTRKDQINKGHSYRSVSSDDPQLCHWRHVQSCEIREQNFGGERKKVDNNMEFSRHKFKLSREIAKEITSQMKYGEWSSSKDEFKFDTPPPDISSDWKKDYRNSCYHLKVPSVNRKNKKEVSENLKTTRGFQEVGLSCGTSGCTMGEMLSAPTHKKKPRNLRYKLAKHGLESPCSFSEEDLRSSDGWRDGVVVDSLKSQSFRHFPKGNGSSEDWTRYESAHCEWYLRPEEVVFQTKSRKHGVVKSEDCRSNFESTKEPSIVKHCIVSSKDRESSSRVHHPTNVQETPNGSPKINRAAPECFFKDTEYQGRLSPVSVLDAVMKEEVASISDCHESHTSDLHGLQNQLELVKAESSEPYSQDVGMEASSDEDNGVRLLGPHTDIGAEGWREFSYLVDVLVEAGSHDGTWDLGYETWHSLECPLSPLVFKAVEVLHAEEKSWGKSERRLLFDRINSGLLGIFQLPLQPRLGTYKQAKPLQKKPGCSRWSLEVVKEELWSLLASEANEAGLNFSGDVHERDVGRFEFEDEVDAMGRDMENFLIDDLLEEILGMVNFKRIGS